LCTRNSSTIEDTKLGKALNLQAFSRTWACAENQVT